MEINLTSPSALPVELTSQSKSRISSFPYKELLGMIVALLIGAWRGLITATGTITRPADTTAYASGDLVANSTTAGSVTPLSFDLARNKAGSGTIQRVVIRKSGTGVTNSSFRVHFYESAPSVTNGDNGDWVSTASGYIGNVDVAVDKAFSDGAAGSGVPGAPIRFKAGAGSKKIYALVEARGAYTPASAEVLTVAVQAEQN